MLYCDFILSFVFPTRVHVCICDCLSLLWVDIQQFLSLSLSLCLCYVKSDVYFTRRLHIISIQMVCVECHDMCTIIYNIYDY